MRRHGSNRSVTEVKARACLRTVDMGNEVLIVVIFTFILVALGAAWVGGYLDAYQSKAQEKALDMMGENKGTSIGDET